MFCSIETHLLNAPTEHILYSVTAAESWLRNAVCPWRGFPGGTMIKNLPANAGDTRDVGSIPGSGRFSGVGNGTPLQDSCLDNSMDRGVWWAIAYEVAKSWTRLWDWAHICARARTHTHTSIYLYVSLYMYSIYICITLLYIWNEHNILNQL